MDFKAKQAEFAAYIRNPSVHPKPQEVPDVRMQAYRELFFNNIDSFLSSNFPVIHTLLDKSQWLELVQDFYSNHTCHTPYFSEIAEEFIEFLAHERDNSEDWPFLLELAHYEWVEMALSIAQDTVAENSQDFINTLENQALAVSPLAWPLIYRYPVEQISPQFLPSEIPSQPTCLLVYRDICDDVQFMKLSPLSFRLLQILQDQPGLNFSKAIRPLIQEYNPPDEAVFTVNALHILSDLAHKNIIIPAEN